MSGEGRVLRRTHAPRWFQAAGNFLNPMSTAIENTPSAKSFNSSVPPAMRGLIPHLVCANTQDAIAFYQRAFDATEQMRLPTPDGRVMHAMVEIGGASVMLADEFPQCGSASPHKLGGTAVTLHLNVDDADALVDRAVAAGAKLILPVQDMFWGDRYGVIEDPAGHRWSIATHVRDLSPEQIAEAAKEMCGGAL